MAQRLKGRNAVVSGAGRGIGRAVALALAEEGANVVVCDIGGATDGTGTDNSPANEVVNECQKFGVKAVPYYGSVADFKAAGEMIKSCVDNFGRVDIVCNIAGIDKPKMIWNMSEEEWDMVIAVHLKGTFNLTRHAVPLMKEQKYGRIINTVSEAYQGGPSHLNYAAAKGGIASFTYGTAREMGKFGVTCNAFIPRAGTRLTAGPGVMEGLQKRLKAGLITQAKLDEMAKGMAPPEYFASLIAYLASDAAANINGQIFLAAANVIGIFSQPQIMIQVSRDWEKQGRWTFDEVAKQVPEKLLVGYVNPAPREAEKK
jgi:NAD(P)-dependent dehydrogenase (short-subunit alcohol dehydrogenase family)